MDKCSRYFIYYYYKIDILIVCKLFKDFCPYNVIGYTIIMNELSHWNMDSVILLNYYLNTCKECAISIIKNPV